MSMTEQELGVLVDPDTIRRSIKRIFTNSANEILGELFQNSQRACASRVDVTTNESGFIYEDNGNGLENGRESFHTLLAMAKSYFNNSTIEYQDPMGLGIQSLMAHDGVLLVKFSSGCFSLSIDTKRWWEDPGYYKSWHERLETVPFVPGFKIDVTCIPKLVTDIKDILSQGSEVISYGRKNHTIPTAQIGYHGIMGITFNGTPVDTEVPPWCRPRRVLCQGEYEGCEVILGTGGYGDMSSVIWYGQTIRVTSEPRSTNNVMFQITVRTGHPFSPMSPSRRGMVMDADMDKFMAWCEDEVFRQYYTNPVYTGSEKYVEGLFLVNEARARTELPVYLASRLCQTESNAERLADSFDGCSSISGGTGSYMFRYDSPLTDCIQPELYLLEGDHASECPFGLSSLLSYIGTHYMMTHGNVFRLPTRKIVWDPGLPLSQEDYPDAMPFALQPFHLPGRWCVAENDVLGEWTDLPKDAMVFAYDDTSSCNVTDCNWTVGVSDPMRFISQGAGYGYRVSDNDDYQNDGDEYEESVSQWRRDLIGNAFKTNFSMSDVRKVFEGSERVVKIEFEYGPDTGGMSAYSPNYVVFTSNKGEVSRRRLIE